MENTEKKVGLAVMRMQPMHNGHYNLIVKMMQEMDIVIIGLGSIQETHTLNNPYTPKQRREMIEKVFGPTGKNSKIKIVELKDLGAVTKIAWAMHVFGKLEGMNLPKPTHYYAGSNHDASWFASVNNEFGEGSLVINTLDRVKVSISMSGTEVRKSIIDETDDWKEYVPAVLVDFIEQGFPKELRLSTSIGIGNQT